jgi:nucleotide-binding universal stress UspA family protein
MEHALASTIAPETIAPVGTARSAPASIGLRDNRIVVGIDGSPLSRRALEWAMQEAARRQVRCRVVEVWPFGAAGMADPQTSPESLEKHLSALVRDVRADIRVTTPADVEVKMGDPVEQLAAAARECDLLVVGSRGHGALKDLFLGSVSTDLLHLGVCPTVVVPANATSGDQHGRVVVGVDGSDQSARALRWAREEAILRHCSLVVLHAWRMPVVMGSLYAPTVAIPFEECRQAGQEMLDQTVAHLSSGASGASGTSGADLDVVSQLVEGLAEFELVTAAAHADLLVVGTRGRGIMTASVLGSTSRSCIHHSLCPVAVIP